MSIISIPSGIVIMPVVCDEVICFPVLFCQTKLEILVVCTKTLKSEMLRAQGQNGFKLKILVSALKCWPQPSVLGHEDFASALALSIWPHLTTVIKILYTYRV